MSGKGGTGKSTVAAALALALAAGGRRVLLVEVEGRQGIAQLFDVPQLPPVETRVASADGGIGAAALWDPPGRWQQSAAEQLRAIPSFLWAFGAAVRRGMLVDERMAAVHPEEPHWYLAIIGSDPTVRGKGFGNALMRSRLDRCDAEYAPAYLESSNPDNVPYYERFGFEVTGEITLPDGPSLIPMWRRPQ